MDSATLKTIFCHFLFVGHHIAGDMKWVTTGPAGVFAIDPNNVAHYLERSHGVVHPTRDILDNPIWTTVE